MIKMIKTIIIGVIFSFLITKAQTQCSPQIQYPEYIGEVLVNSEQEVFYLEDPKGSHPEGGIYVTAGCDGVNVDTDVNLAFANDEDNNYFVIVDTAVKIEEKLIKLRDDLTYPYFPFVEHIFELQVILDLFQT